MSDIMERLRGLADLFEAGDAPRHVVLHMRAGADEIERLRFEISDKHNSVVFLRSEITKLTEAFGIQNAEVTRLRAGGCARDQGTTQYCAEAAKKDAEIANLLNALADARTESMRLRAALREIVKQSEAARKNVAYRKRIRFYENPLNEAHDEGALQAHEILADIARAALEGK